MRILYIANDLAYFRAHRENIALAMAAKGHNVFVASGDWQHTSVSDWPSNMSLIPLDLNKHALDIKSDFRLVQEFRTIITSKRPEIIHAITIKPILMCAIATRFLKQDSRPPDFKMIWTFPGLGKIFEPTRNILKLARKLIVTRALKSSAKRTDVTATFENSEDQDLLVKKLGILPEKTHVLFGTGISLERFTDDGKTGQIDGTQPVFLMATRLIYEKGVDVFLEAAAALQNHPAQPRFVLVGTRDITNPDHVDLEVIDKSVAAGHIEFRGTVPPENMPALYQEAFVFCLPTRLREGFPRSLIEAAACGCALIASDQMSISQIVKPKKTGWLLKKPDSKNLITTMKSALSDRQATILMGSHAQTLLLNLKVSNEEIVSNFEFIYCTNTLHENLLNKQQNQ